ncbi:MAG TPA: response regulator transcription factor [Thermoanaerobaculia bacterium]|nr:response regulator transcription factor [Thermoanaerobaculia bacterium]
MTISLVLADDHPIVLRGLAQLFQEEPDCQVLALCFDGEQALRAVHQHRPDILILDLKMPVRDGLAVLQELRSHSLPTRAVLLTATLEDSEVLEAVRLGAEGVVLKETAPEVLLRAVRQVHAGGQWLERRSVGQALQRAVEREAEARGLAAVLTRRETEIARLVASGSRNKEIAQQLCISEGTVKIHLHNIYEKLKISSRLELAFYLQKRGLA